MKKRILKVECARGFAATYVMLHHLLLPLLPQGSWVAFPLRFGQEAVMLFFLISGFVIFLSTEAQTPSFYTYFSHRWMRIYPIFLLALAVGIVDLGMLRHETIPWGELLGNLFMLQDFSYGKPGVWFSTFGGNSPLWSLAYEWWFYLLFYPIWRFVEPKRRYLLVAVLSLIGLRGYMLVPNQPCLYLMYFILWWTGVELGRQYKTEGQVTLKGQSSTLVTLTCYSLIAVPTLLLPHQEVSGLRLGLYPMLQVRHFASCLLIVSGALFWRWTGWLGFNLTLGFFHFLAPISYGLYAFHYLLGVSGAFLAAIPMGAIRMVFAVGLSFSIAWFAEFPYQQFICRFMRRFTQLTSRHA